MQGPLQTMRVGGAITMINGRYDAPVYAIDTILLASTMDIKLHNGVQTGKTHFVSWLAKVSRLLTNFIFKSTI